MLGFFNTIKQKWDEYGLLILVVVSILFMCILALIRIGKRGTYDDSRYDLIYDRSNRTVFKPTTRHRKDSTGELICRNHLETKFGYKFSKARPNFLKNPVMGGYNLELDCFCPSLKLAIEYNGAQHYKYIPYFHKNKEAFANQKYRDEMKRTKCKENGVVLIEVPYTISNDNIPLFIDSELTKFGFY